MARKKAEPAKKKPAPTKAAAPAAVEPNRGEVIAAVSALLYAVYRATRRSVCRALRIHT